MAYLFARSLANHFSLAKKQSLLTQCNDLISLDPDSIITELVGTHFNAIYARLEIGFLLEFRARTPELMLLVSDFSMMHQRMLDTCIYQRKFGMI